MARNDAASNVQSRKPIKPDQVSDESRYERGWIAGMKRANLCFLYNNVERNLSAALQPRTNLPDMTRYVSDARDNLRIAMRKMGYKGQF